MIEARRWKKTKIRESFIALIFSPIRRKTQRDLRMQRKRRWS
jgi:hypothetical protein